MKSGESARCPPLNTGHLVAVRFILLPRFRCHLPFRGSMGALGSAFLFTAWLMHNSAHGWLEFNTVECFEMLKFVLSIFGKGWTTLNLMALYFSRNSKWAFLPWIQSLILNPPPPPIVPKSDFSEIQSNASFLLKNPSNISASPTAMLIQCLPTCLLCTPHLCSMTLFLLFPVHHSCIHVKRLATWLSILSGLLFLPLLHLAKSQMMFKTV